MRFHSVTRREALRMGAAGAVALLPSAALAAKAASLMPGASACVLVPELDEGPFYFDAKLERSDIRDGHSGAPLRLQLQVVDASNCTPLSGARVDVWHCDAAGFYSGEEGQGDDEGTSTIGQRFLRGAQRSGADGLVTFDTIYPGWYRGRTTHIQFKVILGGVRVATSQLFFPDALSQFVYENIRPYADRKAARDSFNATDSIAQDEGNGHATYCNVKEEADRYLATLVIGIRRSGASPGARPAGPPGPPLDAGEPSGPAPLDRTKLVPGAL